MSVSMSSPFFGSENGWEASAHQRLKHACLNQTHERNPKWWRCDDYRPNVITILEDVTSIAQPT